MSSHLISRTLKALGIDCLVTTASISNEEEYKKHVKEINGSITESDGTKVATYADTLSVSYSDFQAKYPEIVASEALDLLRYFRDKKLNECDWVVTKAQETGTTVSDEWKNYRQALRDLPSSANPKFLDTDEDNLDSTSFTWPTKPS